MAGEIVYADLNILEASSKRLHPARHLNHHLQQCPRWHWITARLGASVILILLGAVIAISVWVSQLKGCLNSRENNSTRESIIHQSNCSTDLKGFHAHLKQFVCESSHNNPAEGSGCKLCPPNWLLHRDKCYWVSKEKHPWNKSRDDCSRRRSRLLVIRDQDEMTFIQTTSKDTNHIWLGLSFTSPAKKWTWVNGSLFSQTLFKLVDPAEGKCAMIKTDGIQCDICTTVSKWICEKDALLIRQ
ncbi:killer cell lectin-like receptor subfamily B member 1B allele A [Dermochelys coriacea]|uniref:killer cell lectin-like receptor subfamily B member 1B allele A n=1 Tax=Dermochelys coriacea TaxID=27794 RepID=UPI001CA968D1|nr:killer cell lectin-like receptor subfamily B member 1B allele A [Dermochelys coriacea]